MELLWLQIQIYLHSPYAPLAIPVVIGVLFLFWRGRRAMEENRQRMKEAASARGMEYTAPKGQGYSIGVGMGSGGASVSEGTHTFTGRTNGVEWTVTSLVLAEPGTHAGRRMGKQYTRWASKDFKTENRDYLILMDLPENMKKEMQSAPATTVKTGFFASLANSMAAMAFNMYANGYFGKTEMTGITFDQTHRRYWPTGAFGENYMVFSNNEPLSKKLLDDETVDFILKNRPFELSFLINANGLMASCPLFMVEPEQIQTIAKFCSELSNRIQKNSK